MQIALFKLILKSYGLHAYVNAFAIQNIAFVPEPPPNAIPADSDHCLPKVALLTITLK
jgi:hypothetical protein